MSMREAATQRSPRVRKSPRRRARAAGPPTRPRRDQQGFVLLTVLFALLLVTLVATAILGLVNVSQKVVAGTAAGNERFRDIDGALEQAVNSARADASLAGLTGASCASVTFPAYQGITVTCADPDPAASIIPPLSGPLPPNPNDDFRVLDFTAQLGGSDIGRARVRIQDRPPGGNLLVGYRMQVCDWQIGQALSGAMEKCPT